MAAVMEKLLIFAVLAGVSVALPRQLGGPQVSLVDDPVIRGVAQFAMSEYNKASNDLYVSKISRIVSAQTQMVSGILYSLNIELGRTQCRRANVESLESCSFYTASNLAHKELCKFVVLIVPWLSETRMVESSCHQVPA